MHARMVLCAMLAGLLLTGCAKFTRENYETVYFGQPSSDVEKVLGQPTVRFEDQWIFINTSPFYKATIFFQADKVTAKQWSNNKDSDETPTTAPAGALAES